MGEEKKSSLMIDCFHSLNTNTSFGNQEGEQKVCNAIESPHSLNAGKFSTFYNREHEKDWYSHFGRRCSRDERGHSGSCA